MAQETGAIGRQCQARMVRLAGALVLMLVVKVRVKEEEVVMMTIDKCCLRY